MIHFAVVIVLAQITGKVLSQDPIVETNVGTIRGLRASDGNYSMFMGIPFAHVNPENVFGNAIPQSRFEGIFDAIDDSAICPQIEEFNFTFVGSLDCLHLNIYVPDAVNTSRPLPVMVYIYGGSFEIGFAGSFLYGPQYLIRYGVILVTFNYRLGPYGFLCLDIPEVLGNQGMKDQVLALKWVQENIGAFGGDPDQVTIFGNSAGAISADLHLVSDFEPMYRGVILESGNAIQASLARKPNSTALFELAALLGNQTTNIYEALSFLNQVDPQIMIEVVDSHDSLDFPICVESTKYPDVPTFLTDFPDNINNLPRLRNISILSGLNRDELSGFISKQRPDYFFSNRNYIRRFLTSAFNFSESVLEKLEIFLRNFYIGEKEVSFEVRWGFADFLNDRMFNYPAVRSLQKYLDNNVKNLFFYLFFHVGGRNFVNIKDNITDAFATHADEIGYLFVMRYIPGPVTPEDQLVVDRMTTMWTNFAKYSNPTPQISTLLPVIWEPITKTTPYHYLQIGTQMSMNDSLHHSRMAFWDLFYEHYGQYQEDYGYRSSSVTIEINPFALFILFLYKTLSF